MSIRRVALIGSRGHWEATVRDIAQVPELQIVALSPGGDTVEPVLKWCAANGHRPAVEDDDLKMLDRGDVDMVVVCGPFELHARMCADAIERGLHVLTEKPAALTFEDLELLREACAKHPKVHLAGMMFSRYTPGFHTARQLIRQGAVGDVRLINARKSYKLGRRPGYYHDRATYGGTIPWVGSHAIDWVMWFAGDAKFHSVTAAHSAAKNGGNGTMEATASCQFTLDGERFASVSIDYLRPANAKSHGDDWARVVGSEGVLEVRPHGVWLINAANDGSTPVAAISERNLVQAFVDHVAGRAPASLDAAATLALTDACLRARQAADEGRAVSFT